MTGNSDAPLGFCQFCGARRIVAGQGHCVECGRKLSQPSEPGLGAAPAAAATQVVPETPEGPVEPVAPAPAPVNLPIPEQPMAPAQVPSPPFAPIAPPPAPDAAPAFAPIAPMAAGEYAQPGLGQPRSDAPPPTAPPLQGYGSIPGYVAGPSYAPAPVRRNSAPIWLGLGVFGLVIVMVAGAASLLSASGARPSPTASPIAYAKPTPTPTPTPTVEPTPTPTPTPVPLPEPTQAELAAACAKGTRIPEAAPYAGTSHSYLVGQSGVDDAGVWTFMVTQGSLYDEYSPGDLQKNGLDPIQLVICEYDNAAIKVGGGYCWYSNSAGDQLRVTLLKESLTIRVLVASTGKTLASKTFYGGTDCPDTMERPSDGSSTMTYTNSVNGDVDGPWEDSFSNMP
jgi:hypothetical protein